MAKVSALTEVTALADADEFLVNDGGTSKRITAKNSGMLFRGAMADNTADLTTQDYTTAAAITFNQDVYDTDSIHDTVSNTSRLTVPTGVTKVRINFNVQVTAVTANLYVTGSIRKNAATDYQGTAFSRSVNASGARQMSLATPVIEVVATDYFEGFIEVETDTSVTIDKDRCTLAMEIIE